MIARPAHSPGSRDSDVNRKPAGVPVRMVIGKQFPAGALKIIPSALLVI